MPYYTTNKSRRSSSYQGQRSFGSRPHSSSGNRRGPKKSYIHPSKFVKAASPRADVIYTPSNQFADFPFNDLLQNNLVLKGIVTPTAIQDQAILPALQGKDVVGIANTGTGKTIAFALPLLDRLMDDPNSHALIMAPTRELAQQIEDECRVLARGSGLNGALLIGGTSMGLQLRDLRARPRIVIGTPGRIKDHIERGTLPIGKFNLIVLDEVDRMLDMGFIDDMRTILQKAAEVRQSFFFSATMDAKVASLIDGFTNEVVTISVKTGETSENVEQDIVAYQTPNEKIEQLHQLLTSEKVSKALVFDETQRSVERLYEELQSRGFKADAIHGGKSQAHRQRALNKFKKSQVNILVATDVAARGIDVSDISHVINYSQPQAYDDYIHRIGRAGRAGNTGYAFTFVKA